ncbi:hypothetical protein TrST_g1583 [Triparma strigata]|uniref:t-SNARE coiled-coil homology domain-containing protein n=1 Tax=Triparma strigata TaxID=1606541 RepID=A0A9W6ZZ26_9STRA|nr:hypothetical protein TrST_g1583 [Triparma strigata]
MDPLNTLHYDEELTKKRLIRLSSECLTADKNVKEFEKSVREERALGVDLRADLQEQGREIRHIESGVTQTFQQINYAKALRKEIEVRTDTAPPPGALKPFTFRVELGNVKAAIAESKVSVGVLQTETKRKQAGVIEERLEEREEELADQISESESKLESYRKVHEAIENEAQEAATKKQTMAAEIEQTKIDIRAMQQRHPAEEKERLEEADDMNNRVTSQQVKLAASEEELKALLAKNLKITGPMKERDELLIAVANAKESSAELKKNLHEVEVKGGALDGEVKQLKKDSKDVAKKVKAAKAKATKDKKKNKKNDDENATMLELEEERESKYREELKSFEEEEKKGEFRLVKEYNEKIEETTESTEGVEVDLAEGKDDVMEVEMELREIRLEIHTEYGDWGDEMGDLQTTQVNLEDLLDNEKNLDGGVKRMKNSIVEDEKAEKKLSGDREILAQCVVSVNKALKFEEMAAKSEKQASIEEGKLKNNNKATGGLRRSSSSKRRQRGKGSSQQNKTE